MKNKYYDEGNLVSVSNSILKYFNQETFHPSLKELDVQLRRNPDKKVALILLDGFGKHIQEVYSKYCPFIRENNRFVISSVFPPTTVAATTALLSGKYPCETGWLGWTEKFEEYPLPTVMFFNTLVDKKTRMEDTTSSLLPYDSLITILRKHDLQANMLQSFAYPKFNKKKFFKKASRMVKKNDFTYIYHTEPDSALHRYGVGSKKIIKHIKEFDKYVKKLVKENPDTLFILLADHGHKNATYFDIKEHEDFYSLLSMKAIALEGRAAMFKVPEELQDDFKNLATSYYGEHFDIYTHDEVIANHIFGEGENSPMFDKLVLDFLLVSKDESVFKDDYSANLKSHHAGTSDDEKYINVSLYNFK